MTEDRQRPLPHMHQELVAELMAPVSVHVEKRGKKAVPLPQKAAVRTITPMVKD